MNKSIDFLIFYFLIAVIIIELIVIVFRIVDNCDNKPYNACLAAYNCKVSEENPEIMYCDYNDEDNNIINIKCKNTLCEKAYDCEKDLKNNNVLNCKYIRNDKEENIKCPNSGEYND